MKATTTVFGILTLTAALATQVHAQTWLTNGLVAYYPFNGNANDASGSGNNGTVIGAQLAMDRFGNTNAAYSFNGIDNYISIADAPSLNPPTAVSLSAWIKVAESRMNSGIVTKFSADNNMVAQWMLWEGLSDDHLKAAFSAQLAFNGDPFNQHGMRVDSTAPHIDGLWHQILMTYDGSVLSLFKDGKVVGSASGGDGTLMIYAQPVEIGRVTHGYHGSDSHFSGLIDDVRIYNRALSLAEVQQLYQSESGPRVALVKAVKPSFSNLTLTTNYQLQVSADMSTWTNQGSAFTATNMSMVYPQYWDVENWNSLFFRLQVVP